MSAFCLTPNRRTEGIITFFVLTWISVHNVTFHFVHKGISPFPRHLRTEHRFYILSEADSSATSNFSFLISLFFFLFWLPNRIHSKHFLERTVTVVSVDFLDLTILRQQGANLNI